MQPNLDPTQWMPCNACGQPHSSFSECYEGTTEMTAAMPKGRAKRSDALPPEEKKRRDRESWARSRAKTGNWSSRAYNLAAQDAARWVRESHPNVWVKFYEVRAEEQRARVEGGELVECTHEVIEQVETVLESIICADCKSLLGTAQPGIAPEGYQVFTGDNGRIAFRRIAAGRA